MDSIPDRPAWPATSTGGSPTPDERRLLHQVSAMHLVENSVNKLHDGSGGVVRIEADTGAVLERLKMPSGMGVSGLESDGAGLFYAGGGPSGKVRAVRRPK